MITDVSLANVASTWHLRETASLLPQAVWDMKRESVKTVSRTINSKEESARLKDASSIQAIIANIAQININWLKENAILRIVMIGSTINVWPASKDLGWKMVFVYRQIQ